MPGSHITIPRDEFKIMRNSALAQKRDIYSNELSNGDKSDDKELEKENDMSDAIVDENGHTNAGYGSSVPSVHVARNHIAPGTHITIPRDETQPGIGNNVRAQRLSLGQMRDIYSNELANGDKADDKELEHEYDPNDAIVDENVGLRYNNLKLAQRRLSLSQMRDIYSNELANGDRSDDKELEKENDMSDAIVDYNGHTNRGYGSQKPSDFFDLNHIMPGSMITVPRDETIPGLGNSLAQRHSLMQIGDIYSNELANGDKSDDKEDERETDAIDSIVDYNG